MQISQQSTQVIQTAMSKTCSICSCEKNNSLSRISCGDYSFKTGEKNAYVRVHVLGRDGVCPIQRVLRHDGPSTIAQKLNTRYSSMSAADFETMRKGAYERFLMMQAMASLPVSLKAMSCVDSSSIKTKSNKTVRVSKMSRVRHTAHLRRKTRGVRVAKPAGVPCGYSVSESDTEIPCGDVLEYEAPSKCLSECVNVIVPKNDEVFKKKTEVLFVGSCDDYSYKSGFKTALLIACVMLTTAVSASSPAHVFRRDSNVVFSDYKGVPTKETSSVKKVRIADHRLMRRDPSVGDLNTRFPVSAYESWRSATRRFKMPVQEFVDPSNGRSFKESNEQWFDNSPRRKRPEKAPVYHEWYGLNGVIDQSEYWGRLVRRGVCDDVCALKSGRHSDGKCKFLYSPEQCTGVVDLWRVRDETTCVSFVSTIDMTRCERVDDGRRKCAAREVPDGFYVTTLTDKPVLCGFVVLTNNNGTNMEFLPM